MTKRLRPPVVVGSARGGRLTSQSGLTLVEIIVALFILGVILSATAASLIAFTQTARQNERQVQATALLNQAHERFQGQAWDVLGTLPSDLCDEVDDAVVRDLEAEEHLGLDLALNDCEEWRRLESDDDPSPGSAPMTFEGREIVLTGDDELAIPAYDPAPDTADGRDYELYQIVTWVDRTGDGNPDLKRLTAIVRWDVVGRPFEQAFVSDRAPSVSEAGQPAFPRLLQYDIFPRTQSLDPVGRSTESVSVLLRFSEGVRNVHLRFFEVDVASSSAGTVVLRERAIPVGSPIIEAPGLPPTPGLLFATEIPAEIYFPVGARPVQVRADMLTGEQFVAGVRNLEFFAEDSENPIYGPAPDPDAPEDGDATGGGGDPLPSLNVSVDDPVASVQVGLDNAVVGRVLCQAITVQFTVGPGLESGDTPRIGYTTGVNGLTPATETPEPLGEPSYPTAGDTIYRYVFDGDKDYGFRNNNSTVFTAEVLRDGSLIGLALSPAISFSNNNNCR